MCERLNLLATKLAREDCVLHCYDVCLERRRGLSIVVVVVVVVVVVLQ